MCLSTCLNVLVGLEEGGGCVLVCARVCVCVLEKKKTHFVTGCVHSSDQRQMARQFGFGAAVDAAVNSQYLEPLTTRPEAQRGRLMFEKLCGQERRDVSEDGDVTISR